MQISPWKQRRQKKQSRPWRSQRKIPQNCHLRFLIFETLSQRFFAAKLGFFQFFQKRQKEAILFCKFLHENWADRKNGVHHDKANGKSFETIISDFWILKLNHRDFSPQSSLLLKKNDLWFRRSLKKPSLLLNDSTDIHYNIICQNKDDKSPNILVYLVALTKKFDKMFLAL